MLPQIRGQAIALAVKFILGYCQFKFDQSFYVVRIFSHTRSHESYRRVPRRNSKIDPNSHPLNQYRRPRPVSRDNLALDVRREASHLPQHIHRRQYIQPDPAPGRRDLAGQQLRRVLVEVRLEDVRGLEEDEPPRRRARPRPRLERVVRGLDGPRVVVRRRRGAVIDLVARHGVRDGERAAV